jgi:hypothetical protein
VQRDPAAVLLLESAVSVLGGSSVRGVHDITIDGNVVSADPNDGASGTFTWTLAGKDFRFDNPDVNGQRSVLISNSGRPQLQANGRSTAIRGQTALSLLTPAAAGITLVRALQDEKFSLDTPQTVQLNGKAAQKLTIWRTDRAWSKSVTQQHWYFDAQSGTPVRVEYSVPADNQPAVIVPAALDLSNYQKDSGVLIPHTWTLYLDNVQLSTSTIDSVTFNTSPSPAVFTAGGGQ